MMGRRMVLGLALLLPLAGVAMADVATNYTKQCGSCHGADGKGKTKMGEKLAVRDLTDPKVQATFSDEQAFKGIADGILDEKTGKVKMPPRKDKLSEAEMRELVTYVRAFSAK
jgi:mono/diheme cytochrome c family protein